MINQHTHDDRGSAAAEHSTRLNCRPHFCQLRGAKQLYPQRQHVSALRQQTTWRHAVVARSAMSEKRTLELFIKFRLVSFWISLEMKNIESVIYPALS